MRPFISLFLLFLFLSPALSAVTLNKHRAAAEPVTQLTPEEQTWVRTRKKVNIGFNGDFPPYSFVDDSGQLKGIAVELITLLNQRLGLEFEARPYPDWNKLYQAAVAKEVDVVATLVNRSERQEWFNFTQPYLAKSLVIVTRNDNSNIRNRTDIANKTVALVVNYRYVERVLEEFPSITPFFVDTFLDGLKAVTSGEADAAITFTGSGHYLIEKYALDNLKIAAFYDHNSANESIAIRKDWPKLAAILQKGLYMISREEKQAIYDQWVPKIKQPVDMVLVGRIVASFLAVLLFLLIWIHHIRKQNKKIRQSRNQARQAVKNLKDLQSELENLVSQRTAELRASENKFRSLVENLRDDYYFYHQDIHGKMTYVSPSVSNLLGYTSDEFLIYHNDYLTDNAINADIDKHTLFCTQELKQVPFEVEIYDKNGRVHWLEVMETPVLCDDGLCIGVDGIVHDITERKETHQLLTSLSFYDELTGLANRRLCLDRLQQAINLAHRNKWSVSVLYLDLNRFKSVNDNFGHKAGDEILKETARRLQDAIRDSDVAARLGGDEFVVLLPETDADAAVPVAQKLVKTLTNHYSVGADDIALDISIGIAVYPEHGTDVEALINDADSAMYRAKKEKSGFAFYRSPQREKGLGQEQLTRDFIDAVTKFFPVDSAGAAHEDHPAAAKKPFLLYYQSRHFALTGEITGFEALLRWHHPKQGLIAPSQFVPIAEQNGLIDRLTLWAVEQAALQALAWERSGIRKGRIAVNLSSKLLQHPDTIESLLKTVTECGASTQWLTMEISESAYLTDPETISAVIQTLQQAGFTVSVDNYGTQLPGQDNVKRLPADGIKIDRSLIRHLPDNIEHGARIHSLIAIAHSSGKSVVAEGVETQEQLDFLKEKGCDEVQGYLFSKPLSADDAEAFVRNLTWFLL
ncbi:MAG: bifunctional diguanylate cyclase/phosphodiesterase [Gammaproteobacteria bacterium]